MARRILVVDDTPINRKLVGAMLKRGGWEPEEADNGEEALARLAEPGPYQAVLLDISMPGLSGVEVCRTLRASAPTAQLPLIAYTAHAQSDEHDRYRSIGFDAVLVKPISLASLNAALEQALAARNRT